MPDGAALTTAQAGLLAVLRGLLPAGAARGSVARDSLLAALDIQDLWRWAKEHPETVREVPQDA